LDEVVGKPGLVLTGGALVAWLIGWPCLAAGYGVAAVYFFTLDWAADDELLDD
jgi:hypothetical protein